MPQPFHRKIKSAVSALWSLYTSGSITYAMYKRIGSQSAKSQNRYITRMSNRGLKTGEISNLKSKVREISKTLAQDMSKRTYRQRDTASETTSANLKESYQMIGMDIATLETALSSLRYWSESTGAYVFQSPTSSTANAELRVTKLFTKCTVRNNYQIPTEIEFYCCIPKEDTNISCSTAFINGLVDQGNPSTTSPLTYLTDSDQFKSLWKIHSSKRQILMPSRELSLTYSMKPFMYDASLSDSHPQFWQRKMGGHIYVIRTSGILAHDSLVATEQGFTPSGVDIVRDVVVVTEYDCGGPSLNDFKILDNSSSFTNAAVVSASPVIDNQSYSSQ